MKKITVIIILTFILFINCSKEKDESSITFSVTGTSTMANISYKTTIGGDMDRNTTVDLSNQTIPWEYQFKAFNKGSDDDTYSAEFCATLIENGTALTLQIYVDGDLKKTDNISNLSEQKCLQQSVELDGMETAWLGE